MEVQQISHQLIKPSRPTPPHLQNMPISFFDQRLAPRTMPSIFYYQNHENHPINSPEHTKRLNLLKKSLSDVLTLFYPLAGRYMKDSFTIRCNDEGVVYSEAVVNVELSEILQGRFEVDELNSLVPDDQHILEECDTSPQLAIQINIFKCGGLAIGMVVSHRIMDAFTSSLFKNGWAKACKTGHIDDSPVPNFEAGVLFPTRANMEAMTPALSSSKSQVVTERFVFKSNEKILSTSMVIGIIWRAQIKAAKARHGVPRSSLLSVTVNLRGKTRKIIPENCCGNFVTLGIARFGVEDHKKEMGLNVFVEKVKGAIKEKIFEVGEIKEDEDKLLYESMMRFTGQLAEEARKGEGDIHRFSSMRGFPFYEVDFGWGKPAWLSFAKRVYKAVLILDTKYGDGVEAWVTMDKEEMEYFRNDSDISSMSFKCGQIYYQV